MFNFYADELYIEPIKRCNLNCKFCYTEHKGAEEINEALLRRFLENSMDINHIYWCGSGEISLWKPLASFINDFPNKTHTVQTNGIDVSWIDRVNNLSGISVNISVDGLEKTHEANRGVGTFSKTVQNIRKLRGMMVPVKIRSIYSDELAKEFSDFLEFFSGHEISITPKDFVFEGILSNVVPYVDYSTSIQTSLHWDNKIYACCERYICIGDLTDSSLRMTKEKIVQCQNCKMYKQCFFGE